MEWGWLPAIGVGLLTAWLVMIALLWIIRPRDVPLGELVRVVPDVARLARGLLTDAVVPFTVKAALVGLLAWLISPIDLIPEFIPVLGPLDDVVVAILVLRYVRRRIGDEELARRWPGTQDGYALLARVVGAA
jgi:uncharacterized membrane protein YkvA (DUF1232 family)